MSPGGSSLLLDEYFKAGDDRFVDEVLASRLDRKLKALAAPWYQDPRPFARRALLRYIDDGCDRPCHCVLVKKLFKLAEAAGDDEAMGHFLVAFDRLRRRRLVRYMVAYDARTRTEVETASLVEERSFPSRLRKPHSVADHERFSLATRRYLQRRALRYFRVLGRKDQARYGRAIRAALALYRDEHLQKPEQLIDSWGLMHALYRHSPVLVRPPSGVRVAPGRSLAELSPAPFHPGAWSGCLDEVLELILRAGSRTVRSFAIALLERDYAGALHGLPLSRVRVLLRSPHEEVQALGARLLQSASGLEALPLAEWMELLRLDNLLALPLICELVVRHVHPDRLALAQCVELACARPAPVAELGLSWARQKPIRTPADIDALLPLRHAEAPRVRAEAMVWLSDLLLRPELDGRPEQLRELIDARYADVRAHALEAMGTGARMKESHELWSALTETPYDDVRAYLVRHLEARQAGLPAQSLRHVWASTLLAVHRGGKAKRAAASQVARRIARNVPERETLLPLLKVTLRSLRPPERRAALAALARVATDAPELQAAIACHLPELKFLRPEVSE